MHPVGPTEVVDHITRGQLYYVLDSVWGTGNGDGGHLLVLHNSSVGHRGWAEHGVALGQRLHYVTQLLAKIYKKSVVIVSN